MKEEEPKKEMEIEEEEKPKENKNIYYSKIYTCSYNNINGKEESYTSQSIKQLNNEHDISEIKENYKNSDGIYKSAYQKGKNVENKVKQKNIMEEYKKEQKDRMRNKKEMAKKQYEEENKMLKAYGSEVSLRNREFYLKLKEEKEKL